MLKKGQHVTIKTAPDSRHSLYNGLKGVIVKIFGFEGENPRDYYVQLKSDGSSFQATFTAKELVVVTEAGSEAGER